MESWFEIWNRKGNENTQDLKSLDGFENTSINESKVVESITNILNIKRDDNVLEVGCGAGMIASLLKCKYTGIDFSESLIKKHRQILKNQVFLAQANSLPFENKQFDISFSFSVFHYFPSKEYAIQTVEEMIRVTKNKIFIGDIPRKSNDNNHLIFSEREFKGWGISGGFYSSDRFNAVLSLPNDIRITK